MSERRRPRPRPVGLSEDEMIIGDLRESTIEPADVWDAAVETRRRALSGFHVVRAVRPAFKDGPIPMDIRRADTAALAGRLADVAIRNEMPVLMAQIAAELNPAPEID